MENEIQIPVTIGGVTFKNPFYVASGPTTKSVRQLIKIEETGWAAASIKLSIDPAPYINRKPRYALFKDRDALAFTAEKRLTFEQGLALIREAKPKLHDLKLFANITYAGDEGVSGWVNMARQFEEAGADVIELNMCCPNMSYNVSLTSGGEKSAAKQTGASLGQQADVVAEIVRAIKKEIRIPLFVKLTPEGGQIAHVAHALYEAGADAVGGTANRLGIPPIDLDNPEQAVYHLQDEISMSCYCSGYLKPLALRDTYEIRKVCGMEPKIMAAGGVRKWEDAVETILCGGNLVGICAETLISGYDIVRPMIAKLKEYMDAHGYKTIEDFCGKVVPAVKTAPELTIYEGYAHIKEPNLSGPCKAACPLHVPVQAYVGRIAEGDFKGAYKLIREKSILQSVCAYICNHPCEDACVRGAGGDPVRIRELKKYVLEKARKEGWDKEESPALRNGRELTVWGDGLKAMSLVSTLSGAGYAVNFCFPGDTPYEALSLYVESGKLPQAVMDDIISKLEGDGVSFRPGMSFEDAETACPEGIIDASTESCAFLDELFFDEEEDLSGKKLLIIGDDLRLFAMADIARKAGAEVYLAAEKLNEKQSAVRELLAAAKASGIHCMNGLTFVESEDGALYRFTGTEGQEVRVTADIAYQVSGTEESAIAQITAGYNMAVAIDKETFAEAAAILPIPRPVPVRRDAVLKRSGYIGDQAKAVADIATDEDAVKEASRCLKCGCGEGCHLCQTICTDFAPFVEAPDRMCINKDDCVACGMCFNRCPNGNIEMLRK